MRRLTSLGLAIVGITAGVVAAVGFFSAPADVGDAGSVEAALATDPGSTTTTTTAAAVTTVDPEPRWSPNSDSLLTELQVTAGPRPTRLRIEGIGVDAPVGAYGVDDNGQMDVPDNVTEVGWYKFGPSPGEPGSAVLAAHVDLAGPGRGLFYDLGHVEVGDTVVVTYEDGDERSFQVVARSTYPKLELPLDVIFSRSGDPVLTLVTCGGGFSRSTGRYDSNVVVFAIPTDSDGSPPVSQ